MTIFFENDSQGRSIHRNQDFLPSSTLCKRIKSYKTTERPDALGYSLLHQKSVVWRRGKCFSSTKQILSLIPSLHLNAFQVTIFRSMCDAGVLMRTRVKHSTYLLNASSTVFFAPCARKTSRLSFAFCTYFNNTTILYVVVLYQFTGTIP